MNPRGITTIDRIADWKDSRRRIDLLAIEEIRNIVKEMLDAKEQK